MKKLLSVLLALVFVLSLISAAYAATDEATEAAETLHALGLFQGKGTNEDGTPIYALDAQPTRNEAVTMLVRLLGKEDEAKAGTWDMPFTDVANWAKPYVGYAYANGLTNGTGATTFGGGALVTATQYLTFVLRALGYDSSRDFKWNEAWELTDALGITRGEYSAENNKDFYRGDVAQISVQALPATMKDAVITLADKLISDGVFTEGKYRETLFGEPEIRTVTDAAGLIAGGHMVLGADLTLMEDTTISSDFELDLNGFTLSGGKLFERYAGTGVESCLDLIIPEGIHAAICNGNLRNLHLNNQGTISELRDVRIENDADHGFTNRGDIGKLEGCTVIGARIGIMNLGSIDWIDNCEVIGKTYSAVNTNRYARSVIAHVTNSRMIGGGLNTRGSGFSSHPDGEVLIENCVLEGTSGGLTSSGTNITVRDSVIVAHDAYAFRMYTEAVILVPTMERCTLIANTFACGYNDGDANYAPTEAPYIGSETCKFLYLSDVADLSQYTAWEMK